MNSEKCDPAIFKNGSAILIFTGDKDVIEAFVKLLCKSSNYPCDWHYAGGRAIVKTLAIPAAVPEIVNRALRILDALAGENAPLQYRILV